MGTYLSARLERPIHLRQTMNFEEFYQGLEGTDLVFVDPLAAWRLHKEHSFLSLARTEL